MEGKGEGEYMIVSGKMMIKNEKKPIVMMMLII